LIFHDNASAHKALASRLFVAQKSITEMEHPPCSPDLSPNDLWLFPEIKSILNRRFQDIEDIQKV
jgi:histone-lysine N-methyltransferase SETMAR